MREDVAALAENLGEGFLLIEVQILPREGQHRVFGQCFANAPGGRSIEALPEVHAFDPAPIVVVNGVTSEFAHSHPLPASIVRT